MNKKICLLTFIILSVDQLTKFIIERYCLNVSLTVIPGFFNIDLCYNTGAAFSMFANQLFFLIMVSFISLFLLKKISLEIEDCPLKNICFSLLYGGILGNLIDRLFIGSVRDFLDFYLKNYHFPTFNVADIAIVVGMFLLVFFLFFRKEVEHEKFSS